MGTDENNTMTVRYNGQEFKYKLLNVLEFTSARYTSFQEIILNSKSSQKEDVSNHSRLRRKDHAHVQGSRFDHRKEDGRCEVISLFTMGSLPQSIKQKRDNAHD